MRTDDTTRAGAKLTRWRNGLFRNSLHDQTSFAMKALSTLLAAMVSLTMLARAADSLVLTDVRVKELAPRQFLCAKKQLKIAEMHEFATVTIEKLIGQATELKLAQTGPIMITYFNFHGDPEETFTGELAVPINVEHAMKGGDFYLRKTEKFKCASTIFQGQLTSLGMAWQNFVQTAMTNGEPTGESREVYLYWEGFDSPNNIVELQLGLK
jgi:effector-binding domain-containing protein